MELEKILKDVEFIQARIFGPWEGVLERWTWVKCDPQVPLVSITGFLSDAVPPLNRNRMELEEGPELRAIVDIIENSALSTIIEFDPSDSCLKYRPGIPLETKEQIARHLRKNEVVIPLIGESGVPAE